MFNLHEYLILRKVCSITSLPRYQLRYTSYRIKFISVFSQSQTFKQSRCSHCEYIFLLFLSLNSFLNKRNKNIETISFYRKEKKIALCLLSNRGIVRDTI